MNRSYEFTLDEATLSGSATLYAASGDFPKRIARTNDWTIDSRTGATNGNVIFSRDGLSTWSTIYGTHTLNKTTIATASSSLSITLGGDVPSNNPVAVCRSGSSVFALTLTGEDICEYDDDTGAFIQSASSPIASPYTICKYNDNIWVGAGGEKMYEYSWPDLVATGRETPVRVCHMVVGNVQPDSVLALVILRYDATAIYIYRESDLVNMAAFATPAGSYAGQPGHVTYWLNNAMIGPVDKKLYVFEGDAGTTPGQGGLDRYMSGSTIDKRVVWPSNETGGMPIGVPLVVHQPFMSFNDDQSRFAHLMRKGAADLSRIVVRDITASRARWEKTFTYAGTLDSVMVAGNLASATGSMGDFRKTKFYWSFDGGGSRTEFKPGVSIDEPYGSGSTVTIDAEFNDWEMPFGPKPYIENITVLYTEKLSMIDVTDYGATPDWNGTTGTDNYAAFQAAIDDAIASGSSGSIVHVPNGSYYVEIAQSPLTPLTINGDVIIKGDGREFTRIVFGPTTSTSRHVGFDLTTCNSATFRDISLDGPTSNQTCSIGVIVGSSGTLTLDSCGMYNWSTDVMILSGAGKVHGDGTKFDACMHNIHALETQAVASVTQSIANVYMHDCDFDLTYDPAFPISPDCNIYVDQGCSLDIGSSRFNSAQNNCVKTINGTGPREYFSIHNCIFSPSQTSGSVPATASYILLPANNPRTGSDVGISAMDIMPTVVGCVFEQRKHASAITVSEMGGIISNCVFKDMAAQSSSYPSIKDGGVDVDRTVMVSNCDFMTTAEDAAVLQLSSPRNHYGRFVFNNCKMFPKYLDNVTYGLYSTAIAKIELNDCHVCSMSGVLETIYMRDGNLSMNNCVISSSARDVKLEAALGTMTASFIDNEFKNEGAGITMNNGCLWIDGNTYGIKVQGRNNSFSGGTGGPKVIAGSIGVHGLLEQKCDVYPNTIGASTTLTLSPNYNTFHVSGSATITTINVTGYDSNTNKLFAGPIYIVRDGDWFFGTGGNIAVASARQGRRHLRSKSTTQLVFDSKTGYWYEQ